MSSTSWRAKLRQTLKRLNSTSRPRIAVVGIGHELRGDDAAGLILARMLEIECSDREHILVVPAGSVPENSTGLLRRFNPDFVLLLDAAQMGLEPGEVRWLAWEDTAGLSASTHSLPLHIFAAYLAEEFQCEVALLGIQPATLSLGMTLSPYVEASVQHTGRELSGIL
jgi:hydrogenase 3 maturation protease